MGGGIEGDFCLLIKTVLTSLLSTFSHTQNAPAKLSERYQMNIS